MLVSVRVWRFGLFASSRSVILRFWFSLRLAVHIIVLHKRQMQIFVLLTIELLVGMFSEVM